MRFKDLPLNLPFCMSSHVCRLAFYRFAHCVGVGRLSDQSAEETACAPLFTVFDFY